MSKTATVLREAANLIEQGWTKGTYYKRGCFCADGALQVAAGIATVNAEHDYLDHGWVEGADEYRDAFNAATDATAEFTPDGEAVNIISFNDEYAESAEDVVAVLRRAAETVDN